MFNMDAAVMQGSGGFLSQLNAQEAIKSTPPKAPLIYRTKKGRKERDRFARDLFKKNLTADAVQQEIVKAWGVGYSSSKLYRIKRKAQGLRNRLAPKARTTSARSQSSTAARQVYALELIEKGCDSAQVQRALRSRYGVGISCQFVSDARAEFAEKRTLVGDGGLVGKAISKSIAQPSSVFKVDEVETDQDTFSAIAEIIEALSPLDAETRTDVIKFIAKHYGVTE